MYAKQSSAGLLFRCTQCHGIFKLFSYDDEKDSVHSKFECDCGRVIKVEETKASIYKQDGASIVTSFSSKEVEKK